MSNSHSSVEVALILLLLAFAGCLPDDAAPPTASHEEESTPRQQLVSTPSLRRTSPRDTAENSQYPSTGVSFWEPLDQRAVSMGDQNPLTAEEKQKAIDTAKKWLEENGGCVDAEFRASRTEDGYSVFVQFHFGYDVQGFPIMAAGGH